MKTTKRLVSFLAVTGLILIAGPQQRAQAMSLVNPGAVAIAKYASEGMTTEVRGGHRGGGHRGGRRGGRRFFFGGSRLVLGPTYAYGRPRFCRLVATPYGPRRICRPRPLW